MSEVVMKAYKVLISGLILVSIPVLAQGKQPSSRHDSPNSATIWTYNDEYIQKAIKNYEAALNSSNDGVVESAIAHVTFMRIDLPKTDLKKIEATLTNLAEAGRTPVIRYKAYLASIVFESPSTFANALKTDAVESDQFFSVIASEVQRTLLGQNMK